MNSKAYHVSKSLLNPGDDVPASNYFYSDLTPEKVEVEEILERARPQDKPERRDAVFLFEHLKDAKIWVAQKSRRVFEVEILYGNILHHTDWCWLGLIEKSLDSQEDSKRFAESYWNGESTGRPVYELIVRTATVVKEVIISAREHRRSVEKILGIPQSDD